MRRAALTAFALATALSAAGESLNHPTGTQGLLLVDKLGGHVRFFDPASLAERSSLELPKNPHDFALSADHRFAYVPIYGPGIYNRNPEPGHELYVIDVAERKVANVIDLSPYRSPHGVQIDANGMLYVTAELDRKVLVIDSRTNRIVDNIDHEGAGHWLAVLPDGSKAYVANKDDKPFVTVLDLTARKQIATVPMPRGTQGIAASPDGTRVIAMDFAQPDHRHRHGDRPRRRPHHVGRHDRSRLQGLLLAGRQVAADDGRLDDRHLRRREPARAAAHVQGRRVADGHRLLG
jgi:DNA-binding beta-propeller fold protein YncE